MGNAKEGMLESIREEINWMNTQYGDMFPEETKRRKSIKKTTLDGYEPMKEQLASKLAKLSKLCPHAPLPDENDMRVEIVFSQQCLQGMRTKN
ncbi:hypothetical protein JCM33374_g4407 [Metschnikowia sp. JCM 33374]|nr:hypothetical protein JCM33374_g4407 [Metschnikowia sp. JCM 33374]